MKGILSKIISTVSAATLKDFADRCATPRKTQEMVLRQIIRQNAASAFGRDNEFSSIRTIQDFQKQLPILSYADHEPYIQRSLHGEARQLTVQKPDLFSTTSGTTGTSKFIPMTPISKSAKSKLMRVWMSGLIQDHPSVFDGKVLTVVSPEIEDYSPGGIPCGAESGHGYKAMGPAIRAHYSTPYEAFEIKSYEAKYYALLRIACGQAVSMIYTCNPSTILVVAQKMGEHTESIIRDVRDGTLSTAFDIQPEIRALLEGVLQPDPRRATELEAAAFRGDGTLLPRHVWPRMACISCWKGGTVGMYLDRFDDYFAPGIPVRDVGYYASEMRGSVVISDEGSDGVLSVTENFFEFSPVNGEGSPKGSELLLADQLERGEQYFIYVTTKGGLYRYDMNDIIEVTGFHGKTPTIRFVQKGKGMVSFTGEKLSETQVIAAVDKALADRKGAYEFITAVGEVQGDKPHYAFLIEFDQGVSQEQGAAWLAGIEDALKAQNAEYASKRNSLRLGSPVLRIIKTGEFGAYRRREVDGGRKDGQFKILRLTTDTSFADEFTVAHEFGGMEQ
jgi:hypothetical protein